MVNHTNSDALDVCKFTTSGRLDLAINSFSGPNACQALGKAALCLEQC